MNFNKKNSLLLFGFLLLVWIAYVFSFSKTIEAHQRYKELKHQDELFSLASQNIHSLKQQDDYYTSLLTKYQISSESSFQNNLLDKLNEYYLEKKLKIINFKNPHRFQLNDKAIQETYIFTIEGNYQSIINFLYRSEQYYKFGKIISINFEKKKNYRTFKNYLQCTIFLQKISED